MKAIASWSTDHRRTMVALWLIVLVGVIGAWQAVGSSYSTNFSLGNTDSQRAADLLKSSFPAQAGDSDRIVIHARSGTIAAPAVRDRVSSMLARVATLPHVSGVVSPYDAKGSGQVSADGATAFATVQFDELAFKLPVGAAKRVIATAKTAQTPALQVALGGQAIQQAEQTPPGSTTAIGLAAAVIVLLVSFGSVAAMGLPIITALFGLGTGIGLIGLSTYLLDMNSAALEIAAMIGLGVGIDYALFILTRFREIYGDNGGDVRSAVVEAMDTAGRAVVFAGVTVIVALLGMFALGVTFLYGLAISAALGVLLVLAASITLLPALLGFFGRRVGRPGRLARLFARRRPAATPRLGFWTRWVELVQRHAWLAAIGATVFMLVLAAPALALRLGNSDAGNDPASSTSRQAYDLLAHGFGAGFNGPLSVVVHAPSGSAAAAAATIGPAVERAADVASVSPARLSPSAATAVLTVYPVSSPQSKSTTALVKELRSTVLPPLQASTGATVYVGGATATAIDFSSVLSGKLWLFIGLVVAISALLLLVVFRSLLIPIQAALMNLLSIGASLGLVTAVFGLGWFPGVEAGPIEAFVPVMMFAIVFGLSMDYEVFLVSRIHEEWSKGRSASEAVRNGVGATGRVITAAATVMIVVFGSFVFGGMRVLELFGLGLAVAVLLDAFIVRSILLPAVFELLGERTWALPAWLERRLPHIAIERPATAPEDPRSAPRDRPAFDPAG
jgi:RND superfamily putative drug exporter